MKQYPTQIQDIKTILQWLVCSLESLAASQLAKIAAICPEDTLIDLDGVATDPENVVEPISQLIVLERNGACRQETIVHFNHFSVEEYLALTTLLPIH